MHIFLQYDTLRQKRNTFNSSWKCDKLETLYGIFTSNSAQNLYKG